MRGKFFSSSKASSPSSSLASSPARTTSPMSTPSHRTYAQSPARNSSPMSTPSHRTYAMSPASSPSRPSFSDSLMEENIVYAEEIINKWDLDSSSYTKIDFLFSGSDRREAKQFIKSVKHLQAAMHLYVSDQSSSSLKIIHAQKLMQVAMKRLEKEFHHILSANRDFLDSETISTHSSRTRSTVSDDDSEDDDRIVSDTERASIADLKAIADCMIASGYGKECVKIYKLIRKSIVDETMYKLGVEKFTFNQINKMEWEVMEPKIKMWLYAVKVALKSLFYGERIRCEYVFSSSEKIIESCFSDICKERATTLFEFPELIARSKKSLERMFRALDLYNAMSELWTEIEMIFSYDSMAAVRTQAVNSIVKLGDAIRGMLTEFETAIQKEVSKTPLAGGGVHPLTRYVMNYLVFLGDYSGALSDIVADWPLKIQSPLPESYFSSPTSDELSPVSARLAWLVLVLLCKLDVKAELYKDVAQSYLFLANNLNYVVSKVKNSNLQLLFGEDWSEKHEMKVKQYAGNYERMAWSKLISSVPENPTAEDLSIEAATECFRRFNQGFEEAYRKQSTWVVSDPKLRDEIKLSVAKKITPIYRGFYEKYRGVLSGVDSVVRYSPDDLGNYLSDLFYGVGAPGSTNTTSQPSSAFSSRNH